MMMMAAPGERTINFIAFVLIGSSSIAVGRSVTGFFPFSNCSSSSSPPAHEPKKNPEAGKGFSRSPLPPHHSFLSHPLAPLSTSGRRSRGFTTTSKQINPF
uniref:Putative secreted protein n=1 Tax=Anopheles darlingi TaxID=43151 RepID=A0A2M4DCB8_ANODA